MKWTALVFVLLDLLVTALGAAAVLLILISLGVAERRSGRASVVEGDTMQIQGERVRFEAWTREARSGSAASADGSDLATLVSLPGIAGVALVRSGVELQ